MIRLMQLQTGGRDRHPPTGARVPPGSPPSKCGLETLEFLVRLARRPTLTSSARGGEVDAKSGRRASGSNKGTDRKQPLCQFFIGREA
jgi:hypothetical protein